MVMYHFFFLTEYWETGFKWKRGHKRSENNYHIYIYIHQKTLCKGKRSINSENWYEAQNAY